MSILRAVWRIVIGDACDWHKCTKPGWKIRVDHGGTRFVLCAEHAVEGKHRNYWRGGPPKCVHNVVAGVGGTRMGITFTAWAARRT